MQYAIKRSLLRISAPPRRAFARVGTKDLPDALFVWIPKSAGTSIYVSMASLGMQKFKSLEKTRCLFTGRGMVTFVHQSVSRLIEVGVVNRNFVDRAFKFSFVRNPHDRCASLYRYFKKLGRLPEETKYSDFITTLEGEWQRHRSVPDVDPVAMSDRLLYAGEEFLLGRSRLQQVGLYNLLDWSQCRPQVDWLKGLGSPSDIHIGRIENADEDYAKIITALSEKSARIPASGVSLPKLNTTRVEAGMEITRDPGIRRVVEEIYAEDFKAFGY